MTNRHRDLTSFPRNEMGEPLMSGEAWRFEQALDAESADDPDRFYDDQYDDSDDPDYCDYHDAIHRSAHSKRQCAAEIAAEQSAAAFDEPIA